MDARHPDREDVLEAIVAWVKSRPSAATEYLLLSLPRTGQPRPLTTCDIARSVGRLRRRLDTETHAQQALYACSASAAALRRGCSPVAPVLSRVVERVLSESQPRGRRPRWVRQVFVR
jgi:hypothetical protein